MGNPAQELQKFNKLDRLVSFPLFLFIEHCHVAIAKAKQDVFFRDVQIGIPHANINTILVVHQLLCGRPVFVIDALKIFKIRLKNVIDVDSPKLLVAPLLPGLWVEVRE